MLAALLGAFLFVSGQGEPEEESPPAPAPQWIRDAADRRTELRKLGLSQSQIRKGLDWLTSVQREDGSWPDSICNEYGTAMASIVLQMPNNYLPIFQR